jgi:hypothetical protein
VAHKSLDAVFMLSKIGGEVTFAPTCKKNRALNAQCFETFGIVDNGPNMELDRTAAGWQAGRQYAGGTSTPRN